MQIGSKPDGRLPKAPKGGGRVKQSGTGGLGWLWIDRGRDPYFHLLPAFPSFSLLLSMVSLLGLPFTRQTFIEQLSCAGH